MSVASADERRATASWFPGHMAAGLRGLEQSADLIDAVLEVRDARLPATTAVAQLHRKLAKKPTFILLNRQDLAAPSLTKAWVAELAPGRPGVFAGVGTSASSLRALRTALVSVSAPSRGHARFRIAVVGAPNTGKSSVINALLRRKRTVVADKPGVTRHLSWLPLDGRTEMLDTPGVLQPKVAGAQAGWQLALCGILPTSAIDAEEVVDDLRDWLATRDHHLRTDGDLEAFARRRGMLRRNGESDRRNAALAFMKDFRAGRFGRITFEVPRERL